MKLPKDRLELVIKPRCGVWKATTSYAPGFRPELAPPRGGTALGSVSAFALWNPTQAAEPPWEGRGLEPHSRGPATLGQVCTVSSNIFADSHDGPQ